MKKRIGIIMLSMFLVLGLVGCGNSVTKDEIKQEKESKKQLYIEKLDNIEIGLKKDLSKLYEGSMAEMREASAEEYKRWDDALNEIYGVLKTQLPSSDMSKLKEEQTQWISDREKKAEDEAAEQGTGTMGPLMYTSSLAQITKDRCYELVEKYME